MSNLPNNKDFYCYSHAQGASLTAKRMLFLEFTNSITVILKLILKP